MTVRAAADQFALAAPASRVTPFGRGLINETYLVETEAGDYVLQRINDHRQDRLEELLPMYWKPA